MKKLVGIFILVVTVAMFSGCVTGGSAYADKPGMVAKGGDADLTLFGKNKKQQGIDSKCLQSQERVEVELANFTYLGDAKIDLLQKLLRLEEVIPLIEDLQCQSVMQKYYRQLPSLKKQKKDLEKVFPD